MRFHILGPLAAHPSTPSPAKHRALLGSLLVDSGRVVPTDALIEELWGTNQPRTARSTLQVYVSQLRKTLSDGGPSVLLTRTSGYLLATAPGDLDLDRFHEQRTAGDQAYASQDYERAARHLRQALALWNGPALADVPQGTRLRTAADRLDLLRLDTLEQRISADLWTGRYRQVIPELTELTRAHPLRESLHAHLMVALYQSHQTSEALNLYDRIRHRLADELGVDPGPGLRELHLRMLDSTDVRHFEQCLSARPVTASRAAPAPGSWPSRTEQAPVVHLPRPLPGPSLRREQLGEAEMLLSRIRRSCEGGVLAITGAPGVGKTAFATELAHRTGDLFPDGRVLITLRGDDHSPLSPRDTLLRVLRRVCPAEATRFSQRSANDLDDVTVILTNLLKGRRTLLVLDDVHSEAQIQPLMATDSTLVVTSRRTALSLDAVRYTALGPLAPEDSAVLLAHAAGAPVEEDPQAGADIARLCEHLPLALRGAAAWLDAHPSWPARMLATRLEDPRTRLDTLAVGEHDVRSRLLTVYQDLRPAERQAFRLMSLTPAVDFAPWSAAALLDVPAQQGADIIETLSQVRLLTPVPVPGRPARFRLDRLTHPLAAELLARDDSGGSHGSDVADHSGDDSREARSAVARLSTAYLHRAQEAERQLTPGRRPQADPNPPELREPVAGEPTGSPATALRWFYEEHASLLDVFHAAHAAGLWDQVGSLAESLVGYYETGAAWEPWAAVGELALDAARRAADPRAEAVALCAQGSLAWQRHQLDVAAARFGLAHRRARQASHRHSEARALIGLADTEYSWGHLEAARRMYTKAILLSRTDSFPHSLCDALRGQALVELHYGDAQAALDGFTACRDTAHRTGDQRWASYASRMADRIHEGVLPGDDASWEIRPGVWSLPDV
ncbi:MULTISPECIES: AfsR/SARP family transcriptional regulator [Streptomyces]|uniref:Transcriptional regulator n=1 Tax=Streptomyces dengpaensis TaxID=2049881 RepID=A0ABN5HXY2_9ACTN|nr:MULTISPECIES: AfsR/SARP family transcriptional regulator [Streptomyces]AVH55814.1 transcriptional regulator [Streptomyces dengpaensis]PIB12068.1 hypothetical protein B1C81_02500 [Streptomyces sp. HG99]